MKEKIELIQEDITELKVDAIVNAANTSLLGGGGLDGTIHIKAGPLLLKECQRLGGCPTGDVKITKGYNLPAKYVIHAVGPVWNEGQSNESEHLANCYRRSLEIALENNIKSIAFPCISAGIYRYPKNEAADIAIKTVFSCVDQVSSIEKIVFCCFSEQDYGIYKSLLEN